MSTNNTNSKNSTNLISNNNILVNEVNFNNIFEELIGNSKAALIVNKNIQIIADKNTTVLIEGETGTGKELVARAIHNLSDRFKNALIKINCAALPSNLIESELFGHEKGAFTGAFEKRIGKFELAHQSTLLLDEIGEMPLDLQAKLLRVLQDKEFERIGSNKTIKVDVRIIASTNKDLKKEVSLGNFRSDLYYRLNIFPIKVFSLKERKEDIIGLAKHFIFKYNLKYGKYINGISSDSINEMLKYDWPGNIRELEHTIERAVILSNSEIISNLQLDSFSNSNDNNHNSFKLQHLFDHEKEYLTFVLKSCKGKIKGKNGAAEILGIPPTTLASKIIKLGIAKEEYK